MVEEPPNGSGFWPQLGEFIVDTVWDGFIKRIAIWSVSVFSPTFSLILSDISKLISLGLLFVVGSAWLMHLGGIATQNGNGLIGFILQAIGLPGSVIFFVGTFLLDFVTIPVFGYSVFRGQWTG